MTNENTTNFANVASNQEDTMTTIFESAFSQYDLLADFAPTGCTIARDPLRLVSRVNNEVWRPATPLTDLYFSEVPEGRWSIGPEREFSFNVPAFTDWDAQQVGRALAHYEARTSDGWMLWDYKDLIDGRHHISHTAGREIALALRNHRSAIKNQAPQAVAFEKGKNGWFTHGISREFWVETDKDFTYLVGSGAKHVKFHCWNPVRDLGRELVEGEMEDIKGKMVRRANDIAFKFKVMLPEIAEYAQRTHWTKYHVLAKLLTGHSVNLVPNGRRSLTQIKWFLADGYAREMWSIAGFRYQDYSGFKIVSSRDKELWAEAVMQAELGLQGLLSEVKTGSATKTEYDDLLKETAEYIYEGLVK